MPFVDFYELGNRLLLVESFDGLLKSAWEKSCGGLRLEKRERVGTRKADVVISLTWSSLPLVPPEVRPVAFQGGFGYRAGSKLVLVVRGIFIETDSSKPNVVSVSFPESCRTSKAGAIAKAMWYISASALRICDFYELHAAGVVEPESGTGFLLIGKSGSGKSSLTARLAGAGWNYLSDDMVVLKSTGSTTEAFALRRRFALSLSSIAASDVPGLAGAISTRFWPDATKRQVLPSIAFPDQFAPSCVPRVLCFVNISNTVSSSFKHIDQSDAMARLVNYCAWIGHDDTGARDVLGVMGKLVRQSKSLSFSAGRDVFDSSQLSAQTFKSMLI